MALTQVSTGGIKDGQVHTADLADAQITAGKLHADALDHTYTLGASGTDHYTFTGEGLTGAVNDPTLYLTRGKTYRFVNGNSSGAHPFRIQSVAGAGGTEYNTGVTNNAGAGGSTIIFEVPHDAPDVLYYICTSHATMNGIFYVTGALADGTVTTAKLADQAVTLAKLPHGDGSSDGKFLRANNGADPTFETINIPAGVGGATGVDFNDDVKARFGTGNDLEIYHNATNSVIGDVGTGNLSLQTNGTEINFWNSTDNEYIARFMRNGSVDLYYNSSKKFETTNVGASVTGDLGIGITTPASEYSRNLQVHAPGTGAVLKLTDSSSGSGTGNGFDLIGYNEHAYVYNRENGNLYFATNGTSRAYFTSAGHFLPQVNNTYDLGSTSYRWRNVYTNDLHLSNVGHTNDVDGTWGDWTIQEGESDLFLKNNRSGKKYKFNLTEVS